MSRARSISGRALAACRFAARRAAGCLTLAVWAHTVAFAETPASPSPSRPNVLLISLDTLRADATGFGGNPDVETPNLDRLASLGRVWSNAHAHSVTTLPSHASILTGLLPYEHGVRENGRFFLDDTTPTLATLLRAAGYATGAFVGAYPLDSEFGLDRGFETYDDDYDVRPGDQDLRYSERTADVVIDCAARWWNDQSQHPRFMWVHLYDAHAPYQPPEPHASRFAENPYLGEVSWIDAALEPLLRRFLSGAEDPTIIVVTSDHGEGLGDHGEATHGLFAYEATLRVPLLIWGPGVDPGTDHRPARLVDVLPTIADLLDLEPSTVAGQSLLSRGPESVHTYFEALSTNLDYGWAPLRGVLSGGMKLIHLPVPELYDLRSDPQEKSNLFDSNRARARELAGRLPAESAWPPAAGTVSTDAASRLRSLGYLGGSEQRPTQYTAADDPKNLVKLARKLAALPNLYASGKTDQGLALAREVVAERPEMTVGTLYLGRFLLAAGKTDEAVAVLEPAFRRSARDTRLAAQLALALVQAGRAADALDVTAPLPAGPTDPDILNARASALASLGRYSAARSVLDRLLDVRPESVQAFETHAFIAIQEERYGEARGFAERALALDDSRPDAWNNLGVALYWLGAKNEAIAAWDSCLKVAPHKLDALLSRGVVLAEVGRVAEARDSLRKFLAAAKAPRHDGARAQAAELLRQLG